MIRRHIDVFAVFVITVGLLALSQMKFTIPVDSIHFENVNLPAPGCSLADLFSR